MSGAELAARLPDWSAWSSDFSLFCLAYVSLVERFTSDATNASWWKDPGLRRCMLNIILLYGAVFAYGYDSALISSVQALPSWEK